MWALLNFVIYYDAGIGRALMVMVNFGAAAYLAMKPSLKQ
jgi:hypothetical protein